MSTTTGVLIVSGVVITGGYFALKGLRNAFDTPQEREAFIRGLQEGWGLGDAAPTPSIRQSDTTGASGNTTPDRSLNSLGDPKGTTYDVGDPHPAAAADPFVNAQDDLRVVHVGDQGTSPVFSSLPQAVVDAWLALFKK